LPKSVFLSSTHAKCHCGIRPSSHGCYNLGITQAGSDPITGSHLSKVTKVPQAYLSKILHDLTISGLILSKRGFGGGFILARLSVDISVYDVLKAVHAAPERLKSCPLMISDHERLCPVHQLLDDALARTQEAFRTATLDTLSERREGVQALCASDVGP
jgi:Rrf2 family protein